MDRCPPRHGRGERTGPWPVLLLAAGALALRVFPSLENRLQWIPSVPWDPLRWLGCHLTHWSWSHVVWDVLVFVVLGLWALGLSRRGFYWTLLLTALAIPVVVRFCLPSLSSYRGLSGLDSALFGLVAGLLGIKALRQKRPGDLFVIGFFAIGFAAKTLFEIFFSQAFFAGGVDLMVPVPLAHAVGVLIGLTVGVLGLLPIRVHPRTNEEERKPWTYLNFGSILIPFRNTQRITDTFEFSSASKEVAGTGTKRKRRKS